MASAGQFYHPDMTYKLFALDIDGTIRSNEYPLSERTRNAIASITDAGAVVTVATGRMFESAVDSTAGLDITSPIISFQGAHVADPRSGEVLWHRPLTAEMATEALDALSGWDREVLAYHGDRVYANILTPWVKGYSDRNRGLVEVAPDLRELADRGLTRLVVVGEDDDIRGLDERLRGEFDSRLHITRSLPSFCEILHPDGGKHKALEWLCQQLGVGQDETVAFGNSYNDVHMLGWAGLGVAIGGAVPEVLAVADRVAPPLEEDGAAQVLEELLETNQIS